MAVDDTRTELESITHALKNTLTGMRSGCMLIDAKLGAGGHEEIRDLLGEMRACVQDGASLVDRLREVRAGLVEVPAVGSAGSSCELAQE